MKAARTITLAPLRARWERQAKRIDALSLRERAIVFLSIVAVMAASFDALVLTPQSARAKLRSDTEAKHGAEVAQLRAEFVAASRGASDPAGQMRSQLEAAQAERMRLDASLRASGSSRGGEGLSTVLQRLLAQQPGLVLDRLALLKDTPVAVPQVSLVELTTGSTPVAASAMPAVQRPGLPMMPGMTWQGVELLVQGGYRDLQRYTQALERELPGLRWGDMHLSASTAGELPRLRAQLFLLKVQP